LNLDPNNSKSSNKVSTIAAFLTEDYINYYAMIVIVIYTSELIVILYSHIHVFLFKDIQVCQDLKMDKSCWTLEYEYN